MAKIKLSVVVLSYNSEDYLSDCLRSIIGGPSIKDSLEILVVDNGSTDQSTKIALGFGVRLIESGQNLGFAKGNNLGLKEAKGELVLVLNPDTVIQPEALKKLVDFLSSKQEELVAVSPLLLLAEGKPQVEYYMRFPNLWQIFLYHNPVLRPVSMAIPFLKSKIAQSPQGEPFVVDQLPGAALMASRKVWQKVGQFEEGYNFLFEDVDWCWRAKKLGVKLMVNPRAKIIHLGGVSWKKKLKQESTDFYYQFFASMLFFVRKNYQEFEGKIFKWAVLLNFVLTLKLRLAWRFFKNNGQQKKFL